MSKIKEINNFFNTIDLFKNLKYDELYNKLIYNNINIENAPYLLKKIYKEISIQNKKKDNSKIYIEEGIELNSQQKLLEISCFINNNNIIDVLNNIFSYLKKKKIKYAMEIVVKNAVYHLIIYLSDKNDATKIIDYINDKIDKQIEKTNELIFSEDKVAMSFKLEYSYNELLSMYLYKFININIKTTYNDFTKYILNNYFKIINQIDLYQFLEFNKRNIPLSDFLINLEIITTLIVYLINQKDMEDYFDYYNKIKKEESKNKNKYLIYNNLDANKPLFEELIRKMYLKYGDEYAKESILNYKNTGKKIHITRENELRKKIAENKTFMVYLHKIDFDNEYNSVLQQYKIDNDKKILEDICKETYLTYNDYEKKNLGKIQIARTLIRITNGDYSSITRNNNARKIAIENIKPEEVVNIIKSTLQIKQIKKETTIYELYAEYIANLFLN